MCLCVSIPCLRLGAAQFGDHLLKAHGELLRYREFARCCDAQPDGDEAQEEAQSHIERCAHRAPLLDELERLVFEGGERSISPDKPDSDEQMPVGMNSDPMADQGQEEPDDKRTRDIDGESP